MKTLLHVALVHINKIFEQKGIANKASKNASNPKRLEFAGYFFCIWPKRWHGYSFEVMTMQVTLDERTFSLNNLTGRV